MADSHAHWKIILLGAIGFGLFAALSAQGSAAVAEESSPAPPSLELNATDPVFAPASSRPTDLQAPDGAHAAMIAAAIGEPVEDLSAKTPDSAHYVTAGGYAKVDQYFGDQFVKVAGDGTKPGDWQTLSTTLVRHADGSVGPEVFPRELTLSPGGIHGGTMVQSELGDTGVVLQLNWPGDIPPVEIHGPRATYRDIAPGIDYVVDVKPSGFEQYFVLKSRNAVADASAFGLDVSVVGGSIRERDGRVEIVDKVGVLVATLPAAWAWDASDDAKRMSPVLQAWKDATVPTATPPLATDSTLSYSATELMGTVNGSEPPQERPVTMSVTGGDSQHLNLTVDQSWLASPETVYPVVIDPMVQGVADSQLATGYATGSDPITSTDLYISNTYPTINWPSYDELRIGTFDSGTSRYRSYINVNAGSMQGKDIVSANLHLFMWHSWSCSARDWQVTAVGSVGSSTSWNNPPTVYGSHVETSITKGYSSSCPDGDADVSITSVAQYLAENASSTSTTMALRLRALSETDNYYWKRFYSHDYSTSSKRPYMTYTYNRDPATPTNLAVSGSSAIPGSTVLAVDSARPTVSAKVSDPDGTTVKAWFSVFGGTPGGTLPLVTSTSIGGNTSGSTVSWQIDTELGWDKEYAIAAQASDTRGSWSAVAPYVYVIRSNVVPAVPTNILVDGLGGTSGTITMVDHVRPQLSATVSDPDGTSTAAYFQIYRQDGRLEASGQGTTVSSTATSTWTPPVDLEMGIQYYIVAKAVDATYSLYDGLATRYSAYSATPSWTFERRVHAPSEPTSIKLDGATPVTGTHSYSGAPTLSATVTDPDGGQVRLAVVVYENGVAQHAPDQILGNVVNSGSVSTVQLPLVLHAGVNYTFRVYAFNDAEASPAGVAVAGTYSTAPPGMSEVPTTCDTVVGAVQTSCGGA